MKRISFLKTSKRNVIDVKGEPYYLMDCANFTSVFLKKKTPLDIHPLEISEANSVKKEKKTDLTNLLQKHFGDDWRQNERLQFYIRVLDVQ